MCPAAEGQRRRPGEGADGVSVGPVGWSVPGPFRHRPQRLRVGRGSGVLPLVAVERRDELVNRDAKGRGDTLYRRNGRV